MTLNQFRDGFAHDCQNLLLPVATLIALLRKRQDLDANTEELLRGATENLQIVRDFLGDASRMYTLEELKLEPVAVNALIETAVAPLREMGSAKGVEILAPPSDLTTIADPRVLPLAIRELLKNAIAAAPTGSRVEIRTQSAGTEMRIDVTDMGPGVSPERTSRLFRPFFTSKRPHRRLNPTFGLGLVHCQAILVKHGGSIGYSRLNHTTCFSVRLPQA